MKKTALLFWILLCTGCIHMRSMSTTSVPADRSKPVEAKGYRFMFLMINTDNRYVNTLIQDLAQQCPNGRVEGILTKHENIMYFPLLAHAAQVTASGFCVPANVPESTETRAVEPDGEDAQ